MLSVGVPAGTFIAHGYIIDSKLFLFHSTTTRTRTVHLFSFLAHWMYYTLIVTLDACSELNRELRKQ